MIEILNLRRTANGFLINGIHETAPGDENYQNALAWETSGKEVMPTYTTDELIEISKGRFKNIYMGIVSDKLNELDYDSLSTVKLWEDDSTFVADATSDTHLVQSNHS